MGLAEPWAFVAAAAAGSRRGPAAGGDPAGALATGRAKPEKGSNSM